MLNADEEKIQKSAGNIKIITTRRSNFLFRKRRRNKFNESYGIKVVLRQKFMIMSYILYNLFTPSDLLQKKRLKND